MKANLKFLLSALVLAGGGCYTQLNRYTSAERIIPISQRPDLAITNVTHSVFHERVMDNLDPLLTTEFYIQIYEVATLVDDVKDPGRYDVTWDASDVSSGVYLCRMRSGNFVDVKKLLIVR